MKRGNTAKTKFTSNGHVVSTSAMFTYYHLAIISPMKRIANEFTISFVIIAWYIGTVIGSFIAIHLHTINRCKSELVLVSWLSFRNVIKEIDFCLHSTKTPISLAYRSKTYQTLFHRRAVLFLVLYVYLINKNSTESCENSLKWH